jgi:DNA adenine methylase
LSQILVHFPNNINRFIEPFTGGGSVFLNIKANEYMLNDIDSHLIDLHIFLQKNAHNSQDFFTKLYKLLVEYNLSRSYAEDIVPDFLKKEWHKTYYAKFNKDGYLSLRKHFNETKDLLELYILLIYGFNRFLRFNSKNEFNLPVGNVDLNNKVINALNNYFDFVTHKNILMRNQDYKIFLSRIDFKENDFIYFDPPYLISASEYNKLWNDTHEQELLKTLDNLSTKSIKWAISNIIEHKGKKNSLFFEWSKKYITYIVKSNYISYHDNTQKETKEVLITNYNRQDL